MSGPIRSARVTLAQKARLEHWLRDRGQSGRESAAAIRRHAPARPIPLSFGQERIWFFTQYEKDSPLYNLPVALTLSGRLNLSAVERSLDALVDRHESLRTRFPAEHGVPTQVIDPPRPVLVERVDLEGRPPEALQEAMARQARRPFDVARDPMLRVHLYRMGPEKHLLLVVKHHIATDGWSENIFLREFASLYREFDGGPAAGLAALPIRYCDYALWLRETLQSRALERQLGYWRKCLAGAPPLLELPTDLPRPARLSARGARCSRTLAADLMRTMQSIGQAHGATLFMTLCAAYLAFLHRYSGLADVVVGTPLAGRTRSEMEGLIGFFVNTLPIRADFSAAPSFDRVIDQVKDSILGALAHQDAPFEKIVEDLCPTRTASHLPLIQTMFIFQGEPARLPEADGLRIEPSMVETGTAKFDLTLAIDETDQGWVAALEYATDLFKAETAERMLELLGNFLEALARQPDAKVAQVPLLSEVQRRQLTQEWNRTDVPYERERSLPEVLMEQAQRTPELPAVYFGEHSLSCRALHARAGRVAAALQAKGAAPGKLIAVCLERSLGMMVGLLGVVRTGAAYVPLDPGYPAERLRFMLDDSKALILVTQQGLLNRFPGWRGPTLLLNDACSIADGGDVESGSQSASISSDLADPAYVIYTSGSTGRPKGVVVTQQNLLNFFTGIDAVLGPERGVWLAITSICFDISALEIWWTLSRGFSVVIASEREQRGESFAGLMRSRQVTHLQCTPSLARVLVDVPESREALRPLRRLLVGGESLSEGLARTLGNAIDGEVYNLYGPTETTVWSTAYKIDAPDCPTAGLDGANAALERGGKTTAIGRPLANTRVYLLDPRLEPVPIGVPGEVYIGGECVAQGYLRRPELTSERFLDDRFRPGGRMYRTGDLGRYRADGVIEFLGRCDHQVKLRGHRIEPAEIEAALLEHPSVHGCVAMLREDQSGEPRIVAYVVAKPNAGGGEEAWRKHLEERLPAHMVPSSFMILPGLPLTPNGKIDRKALPPPKGAAEPGEGRREPSGDIEARMLAIWQSVLCASDLAVTDNFFSRGGHSLLAVQLAARIQEAMNVEVPVSTIYESPSVELLARRLAGDAADERSRELALIQPRGRKQPLYLVHGIGNGMLWGYANLSVHLDSEQPIYAFQSRTLGGAAEPQTIEAMAARFVGVLLRCQPTGPYCLGGYCFGGNVAFEMARQLREQGRDVRLVALFNSFPPNSSFVRMRWDTRALLAFARNLGLLAGEFIRGEVGSRKRYVKWKVRGFVQALRRILPMVRDVRVNPDTYVDMSAFPVAQWPLLAAHAHALRRHRNKPYPGPVTLFRTRGFPPICSFARDYGWGEFALCGVDVRIVPGKHDTMMEEPHVRHLAAELARILD